MPYGSPADIAAELSFVAKRLRDAADGELRNELGDAINTAAEPIADRIREQLPVYMPNRYAGVLNADLSLVVYKFLSRIEAGVTLRASTRVKRRKLRTLNYGILRHPLFGNRDHWYQQGPVGGGMLPGWFDHPAEESAPEVRAHIEAAIEDTLLKIAGKG